MDAEASICSNQGYLSGFKQVLTKLFHCRHSRHTPLPLVRFLSRQLFRSPATRAVFLMRRFSGMVRVWVGRYIYRRFWLSRLQRPRSTTIPASFSLCARGQSILYTCMFVPHKVFTFNVLLRSAVAKPRHGKLTLGVLVLQLLGRWESQSLKVFGEHGRCRCLIV